MIGIIPAAGYGTRFKELGKAYPKSILPYRETPILIWNIEWLKKQGCDDIRVVVHHHSDKIIEIINNYNISVKVVDVIDMSGLSMSIFSALKDDEIDDSVLILLSDILVIDDETKLDFDDNWISTFEVDEWERWCLIDSETGKFFDKPKEKPPTNKAISGVYYFKNLLSLKEKLKEQFDNKEKIKGEYQFSTAISRMNIQIQTKNLKILDFGTLDDYLKNRRVKNCRNFNIVEFNENSVIKKSFNNEKIISEYNWFLNIPNELKIYTPRILNSNILNSNSEYTMERIYLPTLRELYLFFDRSDETWTKIFNSCKKIQNIMNNYTYTYSSFPKIYQKTLLRIADAGIHNDDIVNQFLNDFKIFGEKIDKITRIQHGDFCFSNLFWDQLKSNIVMIDPNGSILGSKYYDWAKLRHSAIYNYDYIDSELYSVNKNKIKIFDDETDNILKIFSKIEMEIFNEEEIHYLELLTSSLFISMIPLHSHNKLNQKIYFDKFKTIYKNWRTKT